VHAANWRRKRRGKLRVQSRSVLSCSFLTFLCKIILAFSALAAEWLACWTQAQKASVQITAAMLSGNSLRQTVHTHRASVHQAAKLVAARIRVARVTAGLAESIMAAYCQVYDSRHLQAVCQEPRSALESYAR